MKSINVFWPVLHVLNASSLTGCIQAVWLQINRCTRVQAPGHLTISKRYFTLPFVLSENIFADAWGLQPQHSYR